MFSSDRLKSKFKNLRIDTGFQSEKSNNGSASKNGTKNGSKNPGDGTSGTLQPPVNLDGFSGGIDYGKITSGNSSRDTSISTSKQPSKDTSKDELVNNKPRGQNNSNDSFSSNSLEEPISPRKLSNKLKFTPSHYVRNSIYSTDFNLSNPQAHTLTNKNPSKNKNSFNNLMKETNKVPPELSPILTLFNCHNFRHYCNGFFEIKVDNTWINVEAKLTGNELAIWTNDEFTPKYFNLFDYNITYDYENFVIKFANDFNESFYNLIIKTGSKNDFIKWLSNFYASNFERIGLNESFTAVILSVIGSKLSDIHTLLSRKKYPKYDWCHIRLPQVNHKWLKVFIVINPSTSKKNGNIEIYQTDKLNKKNLIGYISDASNVYNIFPENINMIEFNSIMKLNGDVFINREFEYLFDESLSASANDSNNSFADKNLNVSRSHSHKRTTSGSSFFSVSSSPPSTPKIKNSSRFIKTNYIYLMPEHHPGVQEIETMIRNLIPIMDCFKLYGRPKHLISDKLDKSSLLFGLPSLPHYKYLSIVETTSVMELFLQDSISENWGFNEWSQQYKNVLEYKLNNENYRGDGNILDLYKSLELDDDDLKSIKSGPSINFPEYSYPDSPTTPIRSPFGSPQPESPIDKVRITSSLSNNVTNNLSNVVSSPKSVTSFKFENFDNLDNIDTVKSPIQTLGGVQI